MVSYGIMCVTRWGGRLGAHPGWNFMSPCGSTLGGDARVASGVVFGVCTLVGGFTSGRAALVNISAIFLSAAVCLSPNFLNEPVWVGLTMAWIRSASACVAVSCEDSLGKVSVDGEKSVVSETLYFAVLGI